MPEVKQIFGQVRAIAPDAEQTRKVQFVLSTSARDRHRTVLNQTSWKLENFNRNPIVGYQHNVYGDPCREPNPDDILGPARAWVEDGMLIGEVTFETKDINPLADKIFRKILNGTLRATSVGFMPVGTGKFGEGEEGEGADNETYYFEGQELLEFSIVNIPSNPEAVKRSLRDQTSNALMFIKKELGSEYSFADIEEMSVREVLNLMENDKTKTSNMANKKKNSLTTRLKRLMIDAGLSEERIMVTATDGTEIEIDRPEGSPEVGDAATIGGEPANGSYPMPDGTEIVCVDGKITEIKPKAEEAAATETETEKNLKAENARLLARVAELEAEVADQAEELREASEHFEIIEKSLKLGGSKYKPEGRSTTFNTTDKKIEVNRTSEMADRKKEYKKKQTS
jgi:hypothetical protein